MSSFNNPANTVNLDVSGQNTSTKCDNCINVPPLGDDGSKNCFEATSIEQINSGKYVSVKNIAARIARKYRNVVICVKHNKAYLPCNIYRILSVYKDRCAIPTYEWDGAYLRFNFDDPNTFNKEYTIELDYLGIMVDDDGLPMILEGHQEACYWYILTKLYFEDYMNGLIDQNRYTLLQDRLGQYVAKAKSSMRHYSRDDMNDIQAILHNMVPKIRMSRNVS